MPEAHGKGLCNCSEFELNLGKPFLFNCININLVTALNEEGVFKPFENRLDDGIKCCSAEGDSDLIIHVPLTKSCKLTGLHLIGGRDGKYPKTLKIYANRPELDFNSINETEAVQTLELVEDHCGTIEYPLKTSKLSNVTHLTFFFSETYGADSCELLFIGLRGDSYTAKREPVVTVYEARGNPADHRLYQENMNMLNLQ